MNFLDLTCVGCHHGDYLVGVKSVASYVFFSHVSSLFFYYFIVITRTDLFINVVVYSWCKPVSDPVQRVNKEEFL